MRKDNQATQDGKFQNSEEKAMDRFIDLMADRLQDIQHDWKKPWFSESAISVPRNLSGRQYNGMNSIMKKWRGLIYPMKPTETSCIRCERRSHE